MCDFDGDTREEKQMLLGARRRIEKIAYAYLEKENITPNGSSPPSAPQNDIKKYNLSHTKHEGLRYNKNNKY